MISINIIKYIINPNTKIFWCKNNLNWINHAIFIVFIYWVLVLAVCLKVYSNIHAKKM